MRVPLLAFGYVAGVVGETRAFGVEVTSDVIGIVEAASGHRGDDPDDLLVVDDDAVGLFEDRLEARMRVLG
jgi:hypothetical protein